MWESILRRMQDAIRRQRYGTTIHADEELTNDALTVRDIEYCILTGHITARQRDTITGRWKYVIRGAAENGDRMEVVAKIAPTGRVVVITVYRIEED